MTTNNPNSLSRRFDNFENKVNKKFDEVDNRIDRLESGLKILEKRVSVQEIIRRWKKYTIDPFDKAYKEAHGNIKKTMKGVEERKKRNVDIAITSLSIASGSILAALLVRLAAPLAKDVVFNNTAKYYLERTLRNARLTLGNPSAQFILGKGFEGTFSMVSKDVKRRFIENQGANYGNVREFDGSPQSVRERLEGIIDFGLESVTEVLRDLQISGKSKNEIEDLLSLIVASPLFHPPTTMGHYPAHARLVNYLELAYYMRFLLTTDKIHFAELTESVPGSWRTYRTDAIGADPKSEEYPATFRQAPNSHGKAEKITISYDHVDKGFIKKMNELCWKEFSDDHPIIEPGFLGRRTNHDILVKAARINNEIQKLASTMQSITYTLM